MSKINLYWSYLDQNINFYVVGHFSSPPGWKVQCAEYFPYSTYFEGKLSSVSNPIRNQTSLNSENGAADHPVVNQNVNASASNGKLEAFKSLTISS